MNIVDTLIMEFLNQFARHWFLLDKVVKAVAVNNLFKGGAFALFIWWAWFKKDEDEPQKRAYIIATLFGGVVSIALARILALALPFRFRPIHETGFNFVLPYGVSELALDGWSSFPSDHAALFFCLAAGLLFVSKRMGIFSLLYATFVICIPRIYIGYHWPTDIIVGAAIGVVIAYFCNTYLVKIRYMPLVTKVSYAQPMFFYPLLFLFTYQIADLFDGTRAVLSAFLQLFENIF